jgi:streptogramin lyase
MLKPLGAQQPQQQQQLRRRSAAASTLCAAPPRRPLSTAANRAAARMGSEEAATAAAVAPRLVAFDLDGTLWYPELYMLSGGAPFRREPSTGAVYDSAGACGDVGRCDVRAA